MKLLQIYSFLLLFCFSGLMFSCKTDFDVTAQYKEIAVVYGLLSQNDTVHKIRINKAFLGDGNALTYAQIPDSGFIGNSVKVTLSESNGSDIMRTLILDTVTVHDKDSGIFAYPDQLVYQFHARLDSSCIYDLRINDTVTGYQASATTPLVMVSKAPLVYPQNAISIDFRRSINSKQKFEYRAAKNGKKYQLALQFHFFEISSADDTVSRIINWAFTSLTADKLDGTEVLSFFYYPESFYSFLESHIPYEDEEKEADLTRIADYFLLTMTILGDEYNTYLDVNGPSTGLLIEKPFYSSINNGIGVFSCDFFWSKRFKVGEYIKKDLRDSTMNFVIN